MTSISELVRSFTEDGIPQTSEDWKVLGACMAVAFLPLFASWATVGSRMGSGEYWYESRKSSWTPPGWVFQVVWPLIYIGMGFALFSALKSDAASYILPALALNIVLSSVWPWLFVNQYFLTSFAVILLMILTLVWALYFHIFSSGASIPLLPIVVYILYSAWLVFAASLSSSFI
jgi:benzodiazapine receptor